MKPIILDVDAGVDDTLAIIYALLSPKLDVRAITTVAGNVPVHACTRNVLLTLQLLSRKVARLPVVAQGASAPLRRKLFTARDVHGNDGIGNSSRLYPAPKLQRSSQPADLVILNLLRHERAMTIVATGPLTNIASAVAKDRKTMERVREIVVMGGGFSGMHNTGPAAEFNFYVDPEAADFVMRSGLPVRLIPLDVTQRCMFTPRDIATITDPELRRYIQRVTKFYFEFHQRTSGFRGGYVHDPLAAVAAAEPSLLRCRRGHVRVEWKGTYARGLSIFFPPLHTRKNAELPEWVKRTIATRPSVRVAESVNVRRFRQEFLRVLRSPRR